MEKTAPKRLAAVTTPRVPEIEGLRAVAAWSIVVFHVWVFTSSATLTWNLGPFTAFVSPLQSGVTLFFVLSGFLLYRPIAAAVIDAKSGPPIRRYLHNRALRILPAYWAILTIVVFVLDSAAVGASGHGFVAGRAADAKTFVVQLLLVQNLLPHTIWSGIPPTWSLTVEVAFYLLLPLLGVGAMLFARGAPGSRRRIIAAAGPVVAMLLLGGAGKALVAVLSAGPERATVSNWHGVLDRSILTHADLFGFGMGAACVLVLWERGLGHRLMPLLSKAVARPLAYFGLPTLFLGYYLLPPYVYDAAIALLAALVLVRLVTAGRTAERPASRTGRLLVHRFTLAAGRSSYSVFLWNFPLLGFFSMHHLLLGGHGWTAFVANLAIAGTAIAGLSALTYRFVEAPALRLKHGAHNRGAAVPAPTPAA
jgi:peptidoglycan/LPS O-acetylase OafA/YrhL